MVVFLILVSACEKAVAQGPQYPLAVAVAPSGDVFLADRNLPGIWKLQGDALSIYFQAEKKFRTPLNAVRCVAIDKDGKLLAGDSATRDVYRFDDAGKPAPLTKGGIGIPMGLAVDAAGDILVSDLELHRIYKVPAAGGEPIKVADVEAPSGLFLDSKNQLWVTSRGKRALYRVGADGSVEAILDTRAFEFPHNIVLDPAENAYIADGYAKAIWKMPAGGKPEKWVQGDPLANPVGLAWKGETLLVVDPKANALFEIDSAGAIKKVEWKAPQ
jgi:sugar lactone lactonase YvrE